MHVKLRFGVLTIEVLSEAQGAITRIVVSVLFLLTLGVGRVVRNHKIAQYLLYLVMQGRMPANQGIESPDESKVNNLALLFCGVGNR